MKTTILALAITGALASTMMAQSVGEKTGVNSALSIAPKTEDFIKEAATRDMPEIAAANVARQNRAEVRRTMAHDMNKNRK